MNDTNYSQFMAARIWYIKNVYGIGRAVTLTNHNELDVKFIEWLKEQYGLYYSGWGVHMSFYFDTREQEVEFRLTWS